MLPSLFQQAPKLGFPPYACMSTIKEVASLAGVSVGTVSHVITKSVPVSTALRKKVDAAIKRLDFHPNHVARSLKTNKTRTLGIVVPDMTISFFPQLIRGAETAAQQQGYSLIAANSYESVDRQRDLLALFRSQQVEGILLVIAAGKTPLAQISKLVDAGVPIVTLDRTPDRLGVDSVSVQNTAAAEMGARHLLAMGYRRIALATGPLTLRNERRRLQGYKNALQQTGIAFDDSLVWQGNLRQEDVAQLCRDRLKNGAPKPDAIFSTNGPTGLGVLRALQLSKMSTPKNIAFLTFDELTATDLFSPAITTIVQPAAAIGRRASEILLQRITGHAPSAKPIHEALPATLEIRASTRPKR